MATQIDELTVKLTADVASFQAAMTGAVGGVTKQLGKIGLAAAGVGAAFGAVGLAANALTEATSKAADFEQSIVNAASKTDNFAAAQTAFKQAAIEAGLATAFSAQQTADALNILSTAGFGIIEATDALPGVLQLAQAGMLSLSDAADITAVAMRGYGFEASELGRVNDVLVSAFTGANQTASELGQALRKAGPLAKTVGQEFETTVAVLSALADSGFKAEEGGTALKVAFARLVNPTKQIADRLKDLGVSVRAPGGQLRDMIDIMADLEKAQANAGDLAVIFGTRAGPTLASLLVQGEDKLRDFKERLDEAGGTAAELEQRQLATLGSQFKILTGTLETVAIAFGSVLGPAIKPVISAFQRQAQASLQSGSMLESFRSVVLSTADIVITFVDIVEALAPAFFAVTSAVRFSANIFQILQKITVGVGRALVGFATLAIGGVIRAVGDLISIAGEAGNALGLDFGPKFTAAGNRVAEFSKDIATLGAEFVDLEGTQKGVAGDLKDMEDAFTGVDRSTMAVVSRTSELRGALQKGRAAVADIRNGAFLGAIALEKFGDAADDGKKKFRNFVNDSKDGIVKLTDEVVSAGDVISSTLGALAGPGIVVPVTIGAIQGGLDFERSLAELEPTFKDIELLPNTRKALKEMDKEAATVAKAAQASAEAAAERARKFEQEMKRVFDDNLNKIIDNVAGAFGAGGKTLVDGVRSMFDAFTVAGPVGAVFAGAESLSGILVSGAGDLIDLATSTKAFKRATGRLETAFDATGLPTVEDAMESFMESLAPVAEIFVTVARALGPIGNLFGPGAFDAVGQGVFNAMKEFVLFVLEFNIFVNDAIATVAGFAAKAVKVMASIVKDFDEEIFDTGISKALGRTARAIKKQAKDAAASAAAMRKARDDLEELTFAMAKLRSQTTVLTGEEAKAALARRRAILGTKTENGVRKRTVKMIEDLNKEIRQTTESLTNVPQGIKIALRRFQATQPTGPTQPVVAADVVGGAGFQTFLGAQGAGPLQITVNGDLVIQASTDEQATTILDRMRNVSNFQKIAESGKLPVGVSPFLARTIGE